MNPYDLLTCLKRLNLKTFSEIEFTVLFRGLVGEDNDNDFIKLKNFEKIMEEF